MQNVRRFLHFDHERRLPAGDVVGRTDARVDANEDAELGAGGRHERTSLRHQTDERGLPEIGRLAAHVRARQDHQLARAAVERGVVRHESAVAMAFDDGVAAVGDRQLVAIVHVRLDVVRERGRFGQTGEHVERRQRACRLLDAGRFGGDAGAKRVEELDLALENPLVGSEYPFSWSSFSAGVMNRSPPAMVCLRW